MSSKVLPTMSLPSLPVLEGEAADGLILARQLQTVAGDHRDLDVAELLLVTPAERGSVRVADERELLDRGLAQSGQSNYGRIAPSKSAAMSHCPSSPRRRVKMNIPLSGIDGSFP